VSIHKFSHKTVLNPENKPTACVIRYGAFGDVVQAMSIVNQLKAEGYHLTFMCQFPGSEVVMNDPNIDRLVVQTPNQVAIGELGRLWVWFELYGAPGNKRFDRWINLTESAESNLLVGPGNVKFGWSPKGRHLFMNHNYVEFQHQIAGVKYVPSFKFYPTEAEIKWRDQERARMKKAGIDKLIMWVLGGSSRTHKVYPHTAVIWDHLLQHYPTWGVVTAGDASCAEFERGYEAKPRIWCASGKHSIRQTLTMMEIADVVVGPETGVMSAAAFYPMPKIVFLSHSTIENLPRDWVNCTPMWAPKTECPGRGKNEVLACHKMLPTFEGCRRHDTYGTAQCVAEILPEWTWDTLQNCMRGTAPKWEPPSE